MILTEITDDLTGAADSGSYFTARAQRLKICISGDSNLSRDNYDILSINLSSRNVKPDKARSLHYELCRRLPQAEDQVFMKKIGTGFRGNDAYELEGLLNAYKDYLVFIVDNAPELGTFTLYGHQYCEGQILHKSVYANDPIMPPTKSYIPEILGADTSFKIGLVGIDAVKGGDLLEKTQEEIASGARIIIFDAITKEDTYKIISTLFPYYPKVFWTGSLGIADGLSQYLFGDKCCINQEKSRSVRCLGFCASAYDIARRQIAYSQERGMKLVEIDIDSYIDGDTEVPQKTAEAVLALGICENLMLAPRVEKYSYVKGTSSKILECIHTLAVLLCDKLDFDRLVIVGGETSQEIFRAIGVEHLELGLQIDAGIAQGKILDGILAGKEFALKGGSMGREDALEKMMCRYEEES